MTQQFYFADQSLLHTYIYSYSISEKLGTIDKAFVCDMFFIFTRLFHA